MNPYLASIICLCFTGAIFCAGGYVGARGVEHAMTPACFATYWNAHAK